MSQNEVLDMIVSRMRDTFEVRRIILFGSQARGTAGDESDYDVLVEVESDLSFWDRQTTGLRSLARRNFAVDLMVLTPEEVREQSEFTGSAVDWALEEGRVIYAR